ncbi:5'-AMP-activated protein kinase subunit gamma [Physcia stellaris]|nr:5'-AMP-activated protein kinase subunit gamma [Physcia stellaris]
MAWEQLSVNKPHWAYLILGGFTSLFMLVSLFVKEKMYIGEATVATICGIIFGPHAANLFDPSSWGNVDQITLECSRIVLVVQCFAVGVELPKAYMERHWKSVIFLLVPVMTFGWLITSLFIWWMVVPLTWLESLMCAACVTATDPVLASSVVGKGKFAKRVPKHLRDLLSAESGCNDGMAFPFIYLSFYLIHYRPHTNEVALHWFCNTILYECVFGCIYGVLIGYAGRHAIKWADRQGLIDRESFLVFYFTLALFCAGTGAMLGTDDLLVGFAAGVGFSNDGWFTHKTEESHVSNVIDLLLNLAYFVYLGSIIPWGQYNAPEIGLTPWRLVVIAIFVIFFRRIPIVMALKPLIPDVKTWREALFAGHFGPIGVGAIFAAILARAELESDTTVPLAVLPTDPTEHNYMVVQVIWPLTTFLVITSILVHGSSIAVFTLGKRINTLTLTMSYTQGSTSRSMSKAKSDFSVDSIDEKMPEFPPGTLPPVGVPGGFLRRQKEEDTPIEGRRGMSRRKSKWDSGMGPGGPISESAIRPQRKRDDLNAEDSVSDTLNEKSTSSPESPAEGEPPDQLEMEDRDEKRKESKSHRPQKVEEPTVEAFEEGNDLVVEDEEGNILSVTDASGKTEEEKRQIVVDEEKKLEAETSGEHAKGKYHPHERNEGDEMEHALAQDVEHPARALNKLKHRWEDWKKPKDKGDAGPSRGKPHAEQKRGPAHAYQFGNTIIVEDEDGEVVKKYDIPHSHNRGARGGYQNGPKSGDVQAVRQGLKRMGTWAGIGGKEPGPRETPAAEGSTQPEKKEPPRWRRKFSTAPEPDDPDDDHIRFTVGDSGGRRMSKQDFITSMRQLDPKARIEAVEDSDAPHHVKQQVHAEAAKDAGHPSQPRPEAPGRGSSSGSARFPFPSPINTQRDLPTHQEEPGETAEIQKVGTNEDRPQGKEGLALVDSNNNDIPFHSVPDTLGKYTMNQPESAAARRRRQATLQRKDSDDDGTERIPPRHQTRLQRLDSDDDGTARVPPHHTQPRLSVTTSSTSRSPMGRTAKPADEGGETAAEKRRRLAALGEPDPEEGSPQSDSDDDNTERKPSEGHVPVEEPGKSPTSVRSPGIRFADSPATSIGRVQWGEGVGVRKGAGARGR